ncbi:MAG: hypothetical protein AAF903_10405 [Pseudomonadota bacterium]
MFLREKKVGKAAYVQLVQSIRTSQGPRSKVVASLGRSDDPKTQLTLQRLAERSASISGLDLADQAPLAYSSDSQSGGRGWPSGLEVPKKVNQRALQRLIMERALIKSGLAGHGVRLFHNDDSGMASSHAEAVSVVANAVAAATFGCGDTLCDVDFANMPHVENLPTALATVLTRGNSENDRLCVHIGRSTGSKEGYNLFGHSIFAVAVNGHGRLLMCVHWPDFADLVDMIAKHVETMLYAMPGRRLILHLDPSVFEAERLVALKRAVLAIHASHVQFITPLHEPSRLMSVIPEQIFEQRPEMPPIEDVKDLRYLRLPDSSLVSSEQAARQLRMDTLDTWESGGDVETRKRDLIRKRLEMSGEWDGTTLLMTNSRHERKTIAHTYLMALKARAFLEQMSRIGQVIFQHSNLPREANALIDKLMALGLLGRAALSDAMGHRSMDSSLLSALGQVCALHLGQGRYILTGNTEACAVLSEVFDLTAEDLHRLSSLKNTLAIGAP